jgi:hypothetical protein
MDACSAPRRRSARRPASLATAAIAWTVLALLAQHGLLLLQRVADGTLSDPAVLGRWVVGLLLVGAMIVLRRAGVSLVRGREAAVFWLVVLIFHTAVAGVPAVGGSPAVALQPGAIVPALLAISALGLGGVPARVRAPTSTRDLPAQDPGFATADGLVLPFSARPPPAAAA